MLISKQLARILKNAYKIAKKSHSEYFTPAHILLTSLDDAYVLSLFQFCKADIPLFRLKLALLVKNTQSQTKSIRPMEAVSYKTIMGKAITKCKNEEKSTLDITNILLCLLDKKDEIYYSYLTESGITKDILLSAIKKVKQPENGAEEIHLNSIYTGIK